LEDHWTRGTRDLIRGGGFSYVVLQQGPSSLAASRGNLREWTQRFAAEIRASGARPALYMVWPDRSRLAYFAQVQESYRLANDDVEGLLLPAGEAWLAAWKVDPKLELYGDGFPSLGDLRRGGYDSLASRKLTFAFRDPRLRNGEEYKVDERKAALVLRVVAELTPPERPDRIGGGGTGAGHRLATIAQPGAGHGGVGHGSNDSKTLMRIRMKPGWR
jgi:hypothetical protein